MTFDRCDVVCVSTSIEDIDCGETYSAIRADGTTRGYCANFFLFDNEETGKIVHGSNFLYYFRDNPYADAVKWFLSTDDEEGDRALFLPNELFIYKCGTRFIVQTLNNVLEEFNSIDKIKLSVPQTMERWKQCAVNGHNTR